ncbi:MAG: hypothetical protein IPM37_15080 [Hahellaceae bacterium]|nr:hypothetical protein [Hahellaceae bacterium]
MKRLHTTFASSRKGSICLLLAAGLCLLATLTQADTLSHREVKRHHALNRAQAALEQGAYPKALQHYLVAQKLTQDESADLHLRYVIGQLQCQIQQWNECIQNLTAWLNAEARQAPQHALQMLSYAHIATEHWTDAITIQQTLIQTEPGNASLWRQLAWLQQKAGREHAALTSYRLARAHGLLMDAEDDQRLVWLLIKQRLPYYAGIELEASLTAGRLPMNLNNLQWLLSCWQQARETDRSLAILDRLQAMEPDGKWLLKKSEIQIHAGRWQDADASLQALAQLSESPLPAHWQLQQGIIQTYLDRPQQARAIFRALLAHSNLDKSLREQTHSWLSYLEVASDDCKVYKHLCTQI